ncbi:hypothetical protein BCO19218_04101 [Burkholderia contaminans]|nr:hypothetical protein BCO19218_04101 [Burkholderia contaminans]
MTNPRECDDQQKLLLENTKLFDAYINSSVSKIATLPTGYMCSPK